jgi:hypothetical protein
MRMNKMCNKSNDLSKPAGDAGGLQLFRNLGRIAFRVVYVITSINPRRIDSSG